MKRFIYIMLLLLLPVISFAQNDQAIRQISQASAALKSMQGDFIQTKHLKMLGDKMVSKGKIYYQQSDKLRWEYISPYTYTFIMNGSKVLLKKGTRKDVIDVNKNKMFKEIARIMMNSMVGKCLTDQKDFKISIVATSQTYLATLIPQRKDMKQMYTKLVLQFNRRSSMMSKVIMFEKNGDWTEIELKNVLKNKSVNASYFAIQ